jgi:hypothetical protein
MYSIYMEAYRKFLKYKNTSKLTTEELDLLYVNNFEELPEPKYKNPRIIFMIFDDLVSDPEAFKKINRAGLSHLVITHRHLQTNLIFTSQYSKAIPPLIRRNIDIFVLFKFANYKSVLHGIYPEVSGYLTEERFAELYQYATKDKHDAFICINHNMVDAGNSVRKN